MESAHKRKRSSTASSEGHTTAPARKPVVESTAVWFDDGNVVLQAGNLLFRVHKSILSLHSPVLSDLFLIAQPDSSSELDSTKDGCPVVKMEGDSGAEWEELLSLIYHGYKKARPNDALSFTQLSAMLRLGHKYSFKRYREEALDRFLDAFGPEWDTAVINDEGIINTDKIYMDDAHSWSDVVNLSHDLHLNKSLPMIYFNAIAHKRYPAYLYEGTKSADGTLSIIHPAIRRHLLCSQDALFAALRQNNFAWMFDNSIEPLLGYVCSRNDGQCSRALIARINKVYTPKLSVVMALDVWGEDDNDREEFCDPCGDAAHANFEEGRRDLWDQLPRIFGLPDWEGLEDFYS